MKGPICGNTLIATSEIHKLKQKPDSNDRTLNDISFPIGIHSRKSKLWKTRAIKIVSYVVCSEKANSNIEFALCIIGYESCAIYIFLRFLLLCPEFHVRKYIFSSWLLCCTFYPVHRARNEVNDRIYLSPQNASRRNGLPLAPHKHTGDALVSVRPYISTWCNFTPNRSHCQTEYCEKIEYILSGCQQRRAINCIRKSAE